jgi:hypothetical protein
MPNLGAAPHDWGFSKKKAFKVYKKRPSVKNCDCQSAHKITRLSYKLTRKKAFSQEV